MDNPRWSLLLLPTCVTLAREYHNSGPFRFEVNFSQTRLNIGAAVSQAHDLVYIVGQSTITLSRFSSIRHEASGGMACLAREITGLQYPSVKDGQSGDMEFSDSSGTSRVSDSDNEF